MEDLKIIYKSKDRIDEDFDKKIMKIAEEKGLEFVGSGFSYEDKTRDLHFEKEKK